MSDSIDARVARVEEAITALKEDRIESRSDRKETLAQLAALRQDVQSTAAVIASLSLGKMRDDVGKHGEEIATLKAEFAIYRRILGSGAGLVMRVVGSLLAAAIMGGLGYAIASGHLHL
jgi:hypothetical protein